MRYLVNNQPADEFTAKRHFQQWYLHLQTPGKEHTVREVLGDWDTAVQLFQMAVSPPNEPEKTPVTHYAQEFLKLSGVEVRQ